jgi:hypothetical protein
MTETTELQIRTSDTAWLARLAAAYKQRSPVLLVDDAGLGVDPAKESLLQMGRRSSLASRDIVALLVELGMAAAGAWLIVMAVLDPEPYSKVSFAIGAGAVLLLGGGFAAVRTLTRDKPPRVRVARGGFELAWD